MLGFNLCVRNIFRLSPPNAKQGLSVIYRGKGIVTTINVNQQEDESQRSGSSESDLNKEHKTKEAILKAALEFVPIHGWSQKSIGEGAAKIGLPKIAHGLFSRSGVELVHYFYSTSNQQLAKSLAEQAEQENKRLQPEQKNSEEAEEIIRKAVQERLRMVTPYIETWPQAMSLMALPQNAPEALRNLVTLVDDIWYYAGDRSTNFTWYTRRFGLAAIYNSTELYLLQDNSSDWSETWSFLDRRIDNFRQLGYRCNQLQASGVQFTDLSSASLQILMNVLELNVRRR